MQVIQTTIGNLRVDAGYGSVFRGLVFLLRRRWSSARRFAYLAVTGSDTG
jgi:hypothetical protein